MQDYIREAFHNGYRAGARNTRVELMARAIVIGVAAASITVTLIATFYLILH